MSDQQPLNATTLGGGWFIGEHIWQLIFHQLYARIQVASKGHCYLENSHHDEEQPNATARASTGDLTDASSQRTIKSEQRLEKLVGQRPGGEVGQRCGGLGDHLLCCKDPPLHAVWNFALPDSLV